MTPLVVNIGINLKVLQMLEKHVNMMSLRGRAHLLTFANGPSKRVIEETSGFRLLKAIILNDEETFIEIICDARETYGLVHQIAAIATNDHCIQ